LHSISAVLPGFPNPQNRAPWPVWRGSVAGPVRFAALSRKQAAQLWHKARRWDSETHQPGRHGGIIGRTALAVLYTITFDFLNHRTGRCDPSLDAIARKAGMARRTVVNALRRLRDLGLLVWQRRCEETRDAEGRFRLRQRTNTYALLPLSNWQGYHDDEPPPPDPATLGAPEPVPDPIEAAVAELTHGHSRAALAALEADPNDALAKTLASFGRAIEARESGGITGVHGLPRNTTQGSNQTADTDLKAAKTHWLRVLLSTDNAG
jgi:Helix-turn-helix domain